MRKLVEVFVVRENKRNNKLKVVCLLRKKKKKCVKRTKQSVGSTSNDCQTD